MRNILALLVLVSTMTGCALGQTDIEGPVSKLGEPGWVAGGSGAFVDSRGNRVFYGIGVASNMRSEALLIQTADDRAQGEVSGVVDLFAQVIIDDYRGVRPDADFVSMEQDIKSVTSLFMTSVQTVRHWTNPITGAVYSVARLYLYRFKDDLGEIQSLDEEAEKYIIQNAERLHDKMIRR